MSENVPDNHGISTDTPSKIFLGAGTIHKGLKFTTGTGWNFKETVMGATQGGNTLTIEPEITNVEIDGAWVKTKGLAIKTGETATMEVNFAEVTPEMLKTVLIGESGTSEHTGWDVLESATEILPGHYIEDFAFAGKTLDGKPIIVIFPSALCTSGLSLEGKSKENSAVPATFECYQDIENDLRVSGYRIYYPTPSA